MGLLQNTAPHIAANLSTSQSGSNVIITPNGATGASILAGAEILLTNQTGSSFTISENVNSQSFHPAGLYHHQLELLILQDLVLFHCHLDHLLELKYIY